MSSKKTLILLFPGFENNADEWSKIVEYGHPNRGAPISFMRRLKTLKLPIRHVDIDWTVPIDVVQFVKDLRETIPKTQKLVLIGHSLGALFCYRFAELFPRQVKLILSLDGSPLGPAGANNVNKVLEKNNNVVLVNYVKQIPLNEVKMPVKSICYRNLKIKDDQVNYKKEETANLTIRYYANIGHFVHANDLTVTDIINDLKSIRL